jgi:hypothetical protein
VKFLVEDGSANMNVVDRDEAAAFEISPYATQWWVVSFVELFDFGSNTWLGSLVIIIPALPTGKLLNFGARPLRIRESVASSALL